MNNIKQYKRNGGAAMMILLIFFITISITILLGIVTPVVRELQISNDSLDSRKSYFMAESGMEDIMYRVKNSMDVGTLGDNRTLFIDNTNYPIPTTMVDGLSGHKSITIEGDVKNRQRTVGVELTTSAGVSFNYGVLVGQGGVYLDSGTVNGNLYSNGPITASSSGGNIITGTAISANNPNSGTNESNGTGTPAYNVTFGNADATQDISQSFKINNSDRINKVQFYIMKSGSPSDATVKIMNDSGGSPGSTILASGTLSASAVTTSYGWINVSFTTNPTLNANTTYWLVIDSSTAKKASYIIGASNGGYSNGLGKIGQQGGTWTNTTPAGLDYYFNLYLGGETGLIQGVDQYNQLHIGTVSGTAQAHTVNAVSSSGNIYCQIGANNNKACISQSDPVYTSFPVSDANIEAWQDDALSGNQINSYTVGPWPDQNITLGPKKINGNLTVTSGGTLTLSGNLWVTGNLVLDGGGNIKLASSYGANDAVIVVDGTITITGGGHATGSGTTGSYIMFLTKSTSTSAATINGGAGAVIVYAPNGTLNISGGASLKEATGKKMSITGGSSITYESGLSDMNFSSGPSGSWSIDSWGESQ